MRSSLIMALLCQSLVGFSQRRCLYQDSGVRFYERGISDTDSIIEVSVVIHNLYTTDIQRIGKQQMMQQLRQLNLDFSRQNNDTVFTPEIFESVAADCRIRFCLANVNPDGMPTSGINRVQTDIPQIGFTEYYYEGREGGQDIWDPKKYLNIWVCEILSDGAIAGFAQAPNSGDSRKDGVVIDYRFFGSDTENQSVNNLGRTATHEVGHWFGLEHPWGAEDGCSTDDGLSDTPQQFSQYRGCPTFPQESCGTKDMFMNFMDLVDDSCMNLFTCDQKNLMRHNILTYRPGLLPATGCQETVQVIENRQESISAYPNPVHSLLQLHLKDDLVGLPCRIVASDGGSIMQSILMKEIDVSRMQAGIYFLTFHAEGKMYLSRFVKW